MTRIFEAQLVIPALLAIEGTPGISTTQLIADLTISEGPSADDLVILKGRKDSKFTQIVRNLVSHHTLDGHLLTTHHNDGTNGYHTITAAGSAYLRQKGY